MDSILEKMYNHRFLFYILIFSLRVGERAGGEGASGRKHTRTRMGVWEYVCLGLGLKFNPNRLLKPKSKLQTYLNVKTSRYYPQVKRLIQYR